MSLFEELKRRNVFRVGIAYVLLGWALLQGADFTLDLIGAPEWTIRTLAVVIAVGLPIALFFAWAFELTPEGIKRESEVDRSASATPETGRKLDRVIIIFLVLVLGLVLGERFLLTEPEPVAPVQGERTAIDDGPASERKTAADSETASRSIAVLPFVNMSADPDNEYFSDGVSEEILNVLAGIPELKVASRTSAFRFKGSDSGVEAIAATLGVSHVLEGSVRKAGEQVRITAQLIQASDGFHLWSETYDRELTNIFAIQDEIAGSIANVLEVQLLGSGKGYTTVQDLNPEDYETFLKARFLLRQRNDDAVAEAISLTRAVLEKNPVFPVGMTQLAEGLVKSGRFQDADRADEIRTLAEQALALEPNHAPAHMIIGQLAMDELRPLEAFRHLEQAIALDPDAPRPHHWLGILLANSGYLERAREALETAVALEPDHANANGYLGFVALLQGEYDIALRQFELQGRLGNPFGGQREVQTVILQGNLPRARELLRTHSEISTQEAERIGLFIDALQDPDALAAYLAFLDEQTPDIRHASLELLVLGQYERALAFNLGGYPRASWADRWPEARALPAFQQKVLNANLPEVWDAYGPPPACLRTPNGYDCANGELP